MPDFLHGYLESTLRSSCLLAKQTICQLSHRHSPPNSVLNTMVLGSLNGQQGTENIVWVLEVMSQISSCQLAKGKVDSRVLSKPRKVIHDVVNGPGMFCMQYREHARSMYSVDRESTSIPAEHTGLHMTSLGSLSVETWIQFTSLTRTDAVWALSPKKGGHSSPRLVRLVSKGGRPSLPPPHF